MIYSKFAGLYNKDSTPQTWQERQAGVIRLKEAKDIDLDKFGKPHRRGGFVLELSGNYKSGWANDEIILAIKNSNLMLIDETLSSDKILMQGVGNSDMVYVAREDGIVYFTNDVIIGKIENKVASYLSVSIENYKRTMPAGYLMEIFNGRLYVAKMVEGKHYLIYSDAYGYEILDERLDPFNVGGRLTMLKAVSDGLWFSTADAIYFTLGATPMELSPMLIVPYGCREGAYYLTHNLIVGKELYRDAILLNTDKGVCVAGEGGKFMNLTESSYVMPVAQRGTGVIRKGAFSQYISITRN